MYNSNSTQQPAAICALKSPADAIHVLEAVRVGLVPRVTRRLTGHERTQIRPGTVWVWEEEETNMRRWTDGRRWGASRVGGGGFLVYTESSDSISPPSSRPDSPSSYPYQNGYYPAPHPHREPLVKQTYSTTMTHPVTGKVKKFHVVGYSSKHNPQGDGHASLPLPHQLPLLANLQIPPGIWPEWERRRDAAEGGKKGGLGASVASGGTAGSADGMGNSVGPGTSASGSSGIATPSAAGRSAALPPPIPSPNAETSMTIPHGLNPFPPPPSLVSRTSAPPAGSPTYPLDPRASPQMSPYHPPYYYPIPGDPGDGRDRPTSQHPYMSPQGYQGGDRYHPYRARPGYPPGVQGTAVNGMPTLAVDGYDGRRAPASSTSLGTGGSLGAPIQIPGQNQSQQNPQQHPYSQPPGTPVSAPPALGAYPPSPYGRDPYRPYGADESRGYQQTPSTGPVSYHETSASSSDPTQPRSAPVRASPTNSFAHSPVQHLVDPSHFPQSPYQPSAHLHPAPGQGQASAQIQQSPQAGHATSLAESPHQQFGSSTSASASAATAGASRSARSHPAGTGGDRVASAGSHAGLTLPPLRVAIDERRTTSPVAGMMNVEVGVRDERRDRAERGVGKRAS